MQQFLQDNFPTNRVNPEDYPSLPLLLSLIDTAIDRKQAFGQWPPEKVADVRQAFEAAIFAVLDFRSPQAEMNSYLGLLQLAYPGMTPEATVISLNYDMILDMAMFDLSNQRKPGSMPSYGCDIRTRAYQDCPKRWGSLFKIHGSVNWMYCSQCHHLDIGWSSKRGAPSRIGQLFFILEDQYLQKVTCPECGTRLRPILVTPTQRKDYRNPHLTRIWYEAERALQRANRAIFVGYSLPDGDVEVIYMLKRGLGAKNPAPLAPQQITLIEKKDPGRRGLSVHPIGKRYRALFGDDIDFRPDGFSEWLQYCQQSNPLLQAGLPAQPAPVAGVQ